MGFWPYFLQAQRSEGTTSLPLVGLPLAVGALVLGAATGAGMHTTFFACPFLCML